MWMGCMADAPLMQNTEWTESARGAPGTPNGGLNSLASNQDSDSQRSPSRESFDPEMTIQMIKAAG